MQAARWTPSARSLLDRTRSIAEERRTSPTTLHLVAAVLEAPGPIARLFRTRGVRVQELRHAARIHTEPEHTFDRVQERARNAARAQQTDASPTHLVVAAVTEPGSALGAWLAQLGCLPAAIAQEVTQAADAPPAVNPVAVQVSARAVASVASVASMAPVASVGSMVRAPGVVRAAAQGATVPALVSTPPVSRLSPMDMRALGGRVHRAALAGEAPTAGTADASRPTGPATRTGGHRAARARGPRVQETPAVVTDPVPTPTPTTTVAPRGDTLADYPALAALALSHDPAAVPVLGRARELERVRDALARREGRGALVVGVPGAGRSALVRALAADNNPPTVVLLRHAELVSQLRGPQGDTLRGVCEEAARAVAGGLPVVLALDSLAPWFTTRDAPDELVLALRALLVRGGVPWVATATPEESRRLADAEPWIDRAAVRVDLEDLPPAVVRAVLAAHAVPLAAHHGVALPVAVTARAADLADRYLGGRAQPDRTLTVLDLALARARRAGASTVDDGCVATVVAELGGMPAERVAATDAQRLMALEAHLGTRVVGHADALARVARVLRRNAVGFRGGRPIGTFLLLGPTGVGKTETAKAIAEALYPGVGAMARFDMGEYAEPHAVARLIGAPPGYVGHADGGQLTEAVRRRPYQLVLLDEIEKAHRDVLEALLGLLDEGRMTDGRGRTVDFRHTVVVMTSNLGAEVYAEGIARSGRSIGFNGRTTEPGVRDRDARGTTEAVLACARAALPPELWNRIDEPVVFGPLARDEVAEVARRLLAGSFSRLAAEQGVTVSAGKAVVELLLSAGGYDPSLGARPMKRAIARMVEAPLADAVLGMSVRRGDRVHLEVRDGAVTLNTAAGVTATE